MKSKLNPHVLSTGPCAECYVFPQAVLLPFGEDQ